MGLLSGNRPQTGIRTARTPAPAPPPPKQAALTAALAADKRATNASPPPPPRDGKVG